MKFSMAFALFLATMGYILPGYAANLTIIQKDKKFSETSIDINLGDTITFQNNESDTTHNVYSITHGNEFQLKAQLPGASTPIVIDKANKHKKGKMLVECAIHPWMKLWVNIK